VTDPAPPGLAAPAAGLTHRQTMAIFVALLMGLFLAAVDGTIVSIALPTFVGDLGGIE